MSATPEREDKNWGEIQRLFAAALERPSAERAAYLREACSDRPELRQRLEQLLASHEQCDDFLAELDVDSVAALLSELEAGELAVGEWVGPYRVLRQVGRGGMGVVYLAERADGQFEQRVALKLVKRGMDSRQILRRFLNERQILARLGHPNIARLLDGGITDDGQPYFAMEFVEGEPFHDYCDRRRLDIPTRLRLFQKACRAVQYAHANLVIHRDLKPSNILVTPEGELKLLDFGIAKVLLEGDTAEATVLTRAGMPAMTPEYAAPEQVRGETLTTATDIYALGVVLYELLTGSRPYRFTGLGTDGVIRAICETEPPRPSFSVGRIEQILHSDGSSERITPEQVSRARSTRPERLRRQLSGDLDTVVLKALRKEPERRYASASALAEDLELHLSGLPVKARPDTVRYRASKFVRRHWLGMAAATVAVAALLTGLALALWQAGVARGEAAKAQAVKEFVLSLFEVSDPNRSKGETISARELLEAGAARIETELAGQPEIQAEMMAVVGGIYVQLGLFDAAEPMLKGALEIRRRNLGEAHPLVVDSLSDLADLTYSKGDYPAAIELHREALTRARELHGEEHLVTARSLNDLSVAVRAQRELGEADSLAREALAMRRRLLGEEHALVAESLINVAVPLYLKADYAAAEPLYREALAIQRRLLGEEHLDVAATLNRLAILRKRKGDYAEAERLYRQVLATYRKILGEEHPETGVLATNLAALLLAKGEPARAEPLAREALAISQPLGEDHSNLAMALQNVGGALYHQGDKAAAEPFFRRSLNVRRRTLRQGHPDTAMALLNLGKTVLDLGRYDEAESLLLELLEIVEEGGLARGVQGDARYLLGACLSRQGRFEEAEPLLLEGYEIVRTLGNESRTMRVRRYLAEHYERRGLPDRARAYREQE